MADVLNVQYGDNVAEDSYSFLPALNVKSTAAVRESIVHHSINGSFAYRKNKWKAIFCPGSGGWSDPKPNSEEIKGLPKFQLYNLNEDIEEVNNLESKQAAILAEYKKELSEIINNGRSTIGEVQKNDGTEAWPQLKWMDVKKH
jgi:hypothetical protein